MNSHLLQDRGQTPCHDKPWSAEAAIDGLGSLPSERHVNMNVFPTYSPSPLGLCPACVCAKLLQSCSTLCNPMDCSPPGSSVNRILQARTLEWVAMTSSRGSSQPRDQTCFSYVCCIGMQILYHQHHLGNPKMGVNQTLCGNTLTTKRLRIAHASGMLSHLILAKIFILYS